ncbi:hypothetical protein L9F63_004108, partial [Diploptera punctata]
REMDMFLNSLINVRDESGFNQLMESYLHKKHENTNITHVSGDHSNKEHKNMFRRKL